MKQIIQNLKTGDTYLEEIPVPKVIKKNLLIKTKCSLVSLGTERLLVEFGKAGILSKARQQPDRVKQVIEKMISDGILNTFETVYKKLEEPIPLGYCNAGVVVEVGEGVADFKVGDRVASNGPHAEYVCVPENLTAHIPENVSYEEAAFTVIGSIGLQGIRLLNPTFGETIVVYGLGLIGLIACQLLQANGCRLIGIDLDKKKIDIAKSLGIITFNNSTDGDPVSFVKSITDEVGADGVLITASAKSNDIISQSACMSRKRGRIILVGVVGLNINRAEFYEKELTFQVSSSYGPGRYDEIYEQKGIDYPLPFVRWTEKRNFESILFAVSKGKLDVKQLITNRVAFIDYMKIYGNMGDSNSIASILSYPEDAEFKSNIRINSKSFVKQNSVIGIIGAGNFTKMALLPVLKNTAANIKYISSAKGVSGTFLAKKYSILNSTTDYRNILNDEEVDLVIITTRHNSHADLIIESLVANKNVFVEKPLALNHHELSRIIDIYQQADKTLTVGFNRRFSPYTMKLKELLGNVNSPINIIATMNAGFIPPNSWVHDLEIGGGRIIGEACHFIDLLIYLTGNKVIGISASALGKNSQENTDNVSVILKFENGSNGVINYFANGNKSYSKERIEVYSNSRTLILDNFRELKGYGFNGFNKMKGKLDKGHSNQFKLLLERLKNGGSPLINFEELVNVSKAAFAVLDSIRLKKWINL